MVAAVPGRAPDARPGSPHGTPDRPVVSSYTEWDPLEEVVVGVLDGAVLPTWQPSLDAILPPESAALLRERGGTPFPADLVRAADRELDGLARALDAAGVTVVRPERVDQARGFGSPDWTSRGGLYAAMPRDLLIVAGQTIIEAATSWRCRQYELDAFRPLVKDYFRRGAGWLAGPRPQLTDPLFATGARPGRDGDHWGITEFEPVFDTADFARFGRDIVVQRSHVTNGFGIDWFARAVGDAFRVREVRSADPHAMHIDATLLPLAPGKLLVHPDWYVPSDLFADWDVRPAPRSTLPAGWPMYFCDPCLQVNVLSLDEHTVVVERQEEPLIAMLAGWGFDCLPLDFRHVYSFGGSFHCVTLDVRRRGGAGEYLPDPA